MRKISPRKAKRIMQQMGMRVEEIPDARQVIIKTTSKEIVIESPEITVMDLKGQRIFQITGGKVVEKELGEKVLVMREEDVHLVAQQAKVGLEEARKALEQTKGDLAQAILLLVSRKV